jgi:putative hemolysin
MDPLSWILFFILIAASAFFSGSEIALITLSKHTVQSLVREKRWWAQSLEIIKGNPDALLITILIGNNLVNVGASALATVTTLTLAKSLHLPDEYGILISTWVVTLILLLFWEITPKTICNRYAIPVSLAVAPVVRFIIFILRPASYLLWLLVASMTKLFGVKDMVRKISYEEVEAFIDMSHEEGEVEADERRQIKNLLSLSETSAETAMTPRVFMEFVSKDMTVTEVCEFFINSSHSRMPVCGLSTDDVDYVITLREAFKLKQEWFALSRLENLPLEKIMKVPLTQSLDSVFEQFQRSRRHIALVLDEHGGTAGVITMEDVIEEVFGDIKDEKDKEVVYIKRTSEWLDVAGVVLIDDILEEFELTFDTGWIPEEYEGESVGYVLLAEKEDFPIVGETKVFEHEGNELILKVEAIDEKTITRVSCRIR